MRQFNRLLNKKPWIAKVAIVLGASALLFWLTKNPSSDPTISNHAKAPPIGLLIPKNHALVPLRLQNANLVAPLVNDQATVDLYDPRTPQTPLLSHVHILKTNQGDEPGFAALVPQSMTPLLQEHAQAALRAVLTREEAGAPMLSQQTHHATQPSFEHIVLEDHP